jgi:hypothetical protein
VTDDYKPNTYGKFPDLAMQKYINKVTYNYTQKQMAFPTSFTFGMAKVEHGVWPEGVPHPKSNINQYTEYAMALVKLLPDLKKLVLCPVCPAVPGSHNGRESSVWYIIQHLNDDHDWLRSDVADWVDRIQEEKGLNLNLQSPPKDEGNTDNASNA